MTIRRFRLGIKGVLPLILLFILIILWFKDTIFYNSIFCYGDLHRYFYPIREFATSSIKGGDLPLWNPYLRNGTPFLAILQTCIFYPVSIVYYILPSFDKAFNWYIILHFFLGGVFMYILTRYLNLSSVASFISSLVYVFGGYLSSVINMNTSLSSVIWLPLVFLFFDMTLKKKRLYPAMFTGIFLAIQFLGGEPTIIYCTILFLFLYFLWFSFFSYKDERNIKDIIRSFGLFLVAVTLWVFITSIQLLPFVELLLNSTRGKPVGFGLATHWSLSPGELLSFFIPYIFGNITVPGGHLGNLQDWMTSFYIGIIPLILVFLAIFIKPDKKTIFFGIFLVLSLTLALGRYTPVYRFLYRYLFGFGHIRYPVKFLFLSSFALSVLSGIGYDSIFKIDSQKAKDNLTKTFLLLNGLLGLLIVIFLRFWTNIYSYIKSTFSERFADPGDLTILSNIYFSDSIHVYRLFIIFTIAILLLIMYLNRKIRLVIFSFLTLSLIFFDLASVNMGISRILDANFFKVEPHSFSEIKKDKTFFRIMRTQDILEINKVLWGLDYAKAMYEREATLACNAPMIHRIFDAQGYGSLSRKDNKEFMNLISSADEPFNSRLTNLLNTKYIISTTPIEEESYEVVFKGKVAERPIKLKEKRYTHFYINRNKACMERAFLIKEAKVVGNRKEVLNILKAKDFDPAKLVILEEEPEGHVIASPDEVGAKHFTPHNDEGEEVHILSYKPDEVIIEAVLNEPKFLVLSDSYYPGWKAFVDGKLDKLYRADYLLRAVFLDRGSHIVKFIFDPLSFKVGKYISITTVGILLLFGLIKILERPTKKTS